MQNGRFAEAAEEFGVGVRVRKDGCFGFAAAPLGQGDGAQLAEDLTGAAVGQGQLLAVAGQLVGFQGAGAQGEQGSEVLVLAEGILPPAQGAAALDDVLQLVDFADLQCDRQTDAVEAAGDAGNRPGSSNG